MTTRFIPSRGARITASAYPGELVVSMHRDARVLAAYEEHGDQTSQDYGISAEAYVHRFPVHVDGCHVAVYACISFASDLYRPHGTDVDFYRVGMEVAKPEDAVPALRTCIAELRARRARAEAERAAVHLGLARRRDGYGRWLE